MVTIHPSPVAGHDYREVMPRIVHFHGETPNTLTQCVTIDILNDEEFEGGQAESFALSLSVYDVAVMVSPGFATVSILDDEERGT